jgi:putative transposase
MYGVEEMCQIFKVSRAGFYSWLKRPKSAREQENEFLVVQIRQIHKATERVYGSPRITNALHAKGIRCNQKRVERLMRINDIRSKIKRKYKVTTHSKHNRPVAANLIEQKFSAAAPNRLWTSDITYIWTREGWLYLAVILDAHSRRIVGWAMRDRMTDTLVIDAFRQAQRHRQPPSGLIVHSDRGSQYCSRSFKEQLEIHHCRQSMSSTGNCYDNAITESFFATLKTELVYHEYYQSRQDARTSIFKYIEMFYNRQRIHSALGGLSPCQYEQLKSTA